MKRVIVLISAPKSGSKWLRDILDFHKDIQLKNCKGYSKTAPDKEFKFTGDLINQEEKITLWWIPHGTLIVDNIIRYIEGCGQPIDIKFIHLIRPGKNVAASYFLRNEIGGREGKEAAEQWKAYVLAGKAYRFLNNYKEVKYYDLITEPEIALRDLFNFLDIEYDKRCLDRLIKTKEAEKFTFEKLKIEPKKSIREVLQNEQDSGFN